MIRTITRVQCDYCGYVACYDGHSRDARPAIIKAGWRTDDGIDRCPKCVSLARLDVEGEGEVSARRWYGCLILAACCAAIMAPPFWMLARTLMKPWP